MPALDPAPVPLLPFLLGLAVTAGLTLPALLRLRSLLAEARAEAAQAQQRALELARTRERVEEDLRFLTQFLKGYPRLARGLYSGLPERQIADVLLRIVQRSLDPQQVVVLVKRDSHADRGAARRFVVAAAYPVGGEVKIDSEVPFDSGEIGFAAERQDVVSRQDLEAETAASRIRPGPALEGLPAPDVIAPLVFDQETLGVILVSGAKGSGDPKAALGLVAQTGAQVLHTAAQVQDFKTTAEMDGLTRIFNRRYLERELTRHIRGAAGRSYDRRDVSPADFTSVFLFDIDHFKNYNDTNGHLEGDRVLQEIASLVKANIRKDDVFGRFGGEEFLLIQPHTDAAQALATADKLRELIASRPFTLAERQPLGRMSVSGGVAQYPLHGLDAPSILRAADEALYEAKRSGRNRVLLAPLPNAAPTPRPGS